MKGMKIANKGMETKMKLLFMEKASIISKPKLINLMTSSQTKHLTSLTMKTSGIL